MLDPERKKRIIAGILLAALEDTVDGEPNNWPAILKACDEMYDGNMITERIADYVAAHFADAYKEGVKTAHQRLVAMRLEGISTKEGT